MKHKCDIDRDGQVVRCKNCKHYDKGLCCKGIYGIDDSFDIPKILKAFNHFYPFAVFEDDYCYRGERKEETK